MPELQIKEVRADTDYVYLDIAHDAASRVDQHDEGKPELFILHDHCELSAPPLNGSVWRGWEEPSTVYFSLANVPDGELDITLRVFGTSRSVLLRKSGDSLESITLQDRKGYRVRPANRELGTAAHAYVEKEECPESVSDRGVR